ncbi:hypothetical protein Tco_0134100 [Tanacetum coccineum]
MEENDLGSDLKGVDGVKTGGKRPLQGLNRSWSDNNVSRAEDGVAMRSKLAMRNIRVDVTQEVVVPLNDAANDQVDGSKLVKEPVHGSAGIGTQPMDGSLYDSCMQNCDGYTGRNSGKNGIVDDVYDAGTQKSKDVGLGDAADVNEQMGNVPAGGDCNTRQDAAGFSTNVPINKANIPAANAQPYGGFTGILILDLSYNLRDGDGGGERGWRGKWGPLMAESGEGGGWEEEVQWCDGVGRD